MTDKEGAFAAAFFGGVDKKEKFKFPLIDNPSLILPSTNDVIKLFTGKNMTLRQFVRFIEAQNNIKSPVSDSSLDSASRKGVGIRVARKIFSFFDKVIPSHVIANISEKMPLDSEKVPVGSNYWLWFAAIAGFKPFGYEEFKPLIEFLELRGQQEKRLFEELIPLRKKEQITADAHACMRKHYLEIIHLDKNAMDVFFNVVSNSMEGSAVTVDVNTLSTLLQVKLDFYFCLFASFEVGLIRNAIKHDPKIKSNNPGACENGIFCRWMPTFKEGDSTALTSPFEQFLIYLRKLAGQGEGPITWRCLAKSIPIGDEDKKYPDEDAKLEAQIDRLKDWRKSSYYPSRQVLERLFLNLSGEEDVTAVMDLAYFAIALDRLVKSDLALISQEKGIDALAAIKEGYSSYPLYWAKYKAMYLDPVMD